MLSVSYEMPRWMKHTLEIRLPGFCCCCCCCCVASVVSNSVQPQRQQPTRLPRPWDSPGKNTGVGCHSLCQGIFPTQGSNLHCRQILYHLNHQGSLYSTCSYYKILTIFSVLYNTHLELMLYIVVCAS